jgi:hypothetical protein
MADGQDKTDELYPIAVLIDELKVRHYQLPASPAFTIRLADIKHSMMMFSYV